MEDEAWIARPSSSEIKQEFRSTFLESPQSNDELRKRAISSTGLGLTEEGDGGVVLRSVYWRIFLNTLPLSSIASSSLSSHLSSSRSLYDLKRRQYLRAPDGRWAEDCSIAGVADRRMSSDGDGGVVGEEEGWDPLSLGEANPWKDWFQQQELRKVIMQDVERTFPDIPYFHSQSTRRSLLTILFLWSIQHPEIGYRQGMHELLAVILMVVDRDSLSPSPRTESGMYSPLTTETPHDPAELILARRWVEHDTFALYNALMGGAKKWYEWRSETEGGGRGVAGKSPRQQAKIIEICNAVQGMIKGVDPILNGRLEAEGVEGQIWAIRYIRLLFTRELPLSMAMRLWDGVFAVDPMFEKGMVESVCVALIMRIRNLLIPADYAMILTTLLRYPPHSASFPLSVPLILSQAVLIRDNIAPSTGAAITLQNQEQLGIKALAEEAEVEVETRRPMPRRVGPPQGRQGVVQSSPLEGLAKGLLERAQAAGLDKAILSTVSEFRRNLPEFSAPPTSAFSFRTFSPPSSDGFSTIPDIDVVVSKPPPRTLRDADREIAELRLVMIGMGKAMDKWLDGVQPPPTELELEENAMATSNWQGLRRLQQALLDGGSAPTADLARDWAWSNDLESRRVTPLGSVDEDALANSVQSLASDTVLLTHPTSSEPSTRPPSVNRQGASSSSQAKPQIHPPFTTSFTSMMNGTSPRQFAFPSPFATHDSAAASRRHGTPISLPPSISTSPRPDVASRLSAASQSASIDHYPPSTSKSVEPLSGSAVETRPTKKELDPLLGVGI